MPSQMFHLRWAAPPSIEVHSRYALVRHGGRLYSYEELLRHIPVAHLPDVAGFTSETPQTVWDELTRRTPRAVGKAVAACRPRDFEILDLYDAEAVGTA